SLPLSISSTSRATPSISTLSLHDALPIYFTSELHRVGETPDCETLSGAPTARGAWPPPQAGAFSRCDPAPIDPRLHSRSGRPPRSEEHTSELQSRSDLVCRLLLEKKKHHT